MNNEDIKRKFMEQKEYKVGTQKILHRLFTAAQPSEEAYGKDLYNFSREELRRLFYVFAPKTEASSANNVSMISLYIQWAIDEGYIKGLSPLEGVSVKWKRQFAFTEGKRLWTDKELDKIVASRVNYSDKVIIETLRSGVRGEANSEILNLKASDIDEANQQLTLTNETGSTRVIKVSEDCIRICKAAVFETFYEKSNGFALNAKAPKAQLISNQYVVRSALTRNANFEEASNSIIHQRLSKVADGLNEKFFVPLNITRSGMLAMAKDRYLKYGRLPDEDANEIIAHFGYPKISEYRLKTEFLNEAKIKEIYNLTE